MTQPAQPIAYISRSAVKGHLISAFQTMRRLVESIADVVDGRPLAGGPSLGHRLAALQEHMLGEIRWLQSVAASIDGTALIGGADRREFLKRYSIELAYLAKALHDAVQAGPVSESLPPEAHAKGWRRVSTGILRVLALEDEARQL